VVLLPKVENAERVRLTLELLDALGAPPELAVWCMIETPLGVLAAADIAAASPCIGALVLGTSDLANDLHARPARDRLPLLTALQPAHPCLRGSKRPRQGRRPFRRAPDRGAPCRRSAAHPRPRRRHHRPGGFLAPTRPLRGPPSPACGGGRPAAKAAGGWGLT